MCVRYTLHNLEAALSAIARALDRQFASPEWARPKHNITLTHVVSTVAISDGEPVVRGMAWGLVPPYAGGAAQLMPNAAAEKAASSPAFREATATRRCLVPANGFYEWATAGKLKLPHLFTLRDEEPFAFAGIWSPRADADLPPAFAILTTVPNELVAPIHHRMPVILTRETMPRWIGTAPLPAAEYHALTRPLDYRRMQQRPVSRFVNNSRNDGPQCLAPAEPDFAEPELDFS